MRAARDVFGELGYDAATFQAIALRADLTRPAINHYFASKRVLYREVLAQTNATVLAAGVTQASSEHTLVGRMAAFVAAITQADDADRSAAAFLVTSVLESQRHPDLQFPGHDALVETRRFLRGAVEAAMASGELPVDTDAAPVVEVLVSMVWGIGFYAGYVRGRVDVATLTDLFRRLLIGQLGDLRP